MVSVIVSFGWTPARECDGGPIDALPIVGPPRESGTWKPLGKKNRRFACGALPETGTVSSQAARRGKGTTLTCQDISRGLSWAPTEAMGISRTTHDGASPTVAAIDSIAPESAVNTITDGPAPDMAAA